MRRFLSISFLALALMIGATGAAPVAHAQFYDNGGTSYATQAEASAADAAQLGTAAVAQTAATAAANQTPITPNPGSSDTAFNPVMTAIAGLFAWLVGVAALTLDYSVYYTVVNMGAYIHKLTAIGVTWRILRDIGNIMLIFGFLAIGISIVLNSEWYASGKKMLPMLLVAAVFLNFSLFFSEAIIDTGNLFATQFYTQINGGVTPTADTLKGITTANQGISSKLMSQLGLTTIYNVKDNVALLRGDTPWYIGFLAILLFIVTAFVMFSLAFILIARFVILVFLIILAPIGFAGLAVPQLKHKAGQWWGALFQQTITAPVLLLLLYVALAVITDAQFLTGLGGGSAGAITGFVDNNNLAAFASYMMSFSIAIGLMLAVTISAKSLSAFGADKATALAGKLSFGATAFAGRTTVGWGANRLAKYARSTRLARVPLVGTGIVKGLDKVATGSFDVRGATSVAGLKEAGAPQKGGYRAELKARTESRTKYAKDLTGEKLTDDETAEIAVAENKIAEMRKDQKGKTVEQILAINKDIKKKEEEIEKLEEKTAKGAQRKYAENLELNFTGKSTFFNEKSTFNKYFNFAANTEAAQTIRKEAKKSTDDKTLDELKKSLKKAGGEEEHPAPTVPVAGGAAPAPAAGGH